MAYLRVLLFVLPATCASFRRGHVAAVAAAPEAKVQRLLVDIDESLRKAGQDSELVFATLSNYEQQFGVSLDREVTMLNETLSKLTAMNTEYRLELNSSRDELSYLGSSMQGSEQASQAYGKSEAQQGAKYDSLLVSVRMLTSLLKSARVTPDGELATPEAPGADGQPKRVHTVMWQLLSSRPNLRSSYPDVFDFFAPRTSAGAPARRAATPALLRRAVSALQAVGTALKADKEKSLLQLEGRRQQFATEADNDELSAESQKGIQAEDEQKSEELLFSINFTRAVLHVDRTFRTKLRAHLSARMNLTGGARRSREGLLKSLKDAIALLDTQSAKSPIAVMAAPAAPGAGGGVSFLETMTRARKLRRRGAGASDARGKTTAKAGALEAAVEDAIRKKGDTHAILMKVKSMLDRAMPIDARSVQGVVTQMGDVLRGVESEQTHASDAARRCQTQQLRAAQEDRSLKANLALMQGAQNHTRAAIQAAKQNLAGIASKLGALTRSSGDFAQLVTEGSETLSNEGRDRATITAALQKAREVVQRAMPEKSDLADSLELMSTELTGQDGLERAYRTEESAFQAALGQYVADYSSLLQERRSHYKQTSAALDLYTSELANDIVAQSDSVDTNKELVSETHMLCDSVLKFYKQHGERRTELTRALKTVLPKVPSILSLGLGADAAGESDA